MKTYNPAAPGVSSFLSGPPFTPEPGVSRREPPQDYRALLLGAVDSTGSEDPPIHIGGDRQGTDGVDSTMVTASDSLAEEMRSRTGGGNPSSSLVNLRGPFDHMNLVEESTIADTPRSTPWFPSRVRPFDYLASSDPSRDTGPIQQPAYQQSSHSSRGLTSLPTFSSNAPFLGGTFPSLDIPPQSSLHFAGEDGLSPTTASSLFGPQLPLDLEDPPLDHRTPSEPRYSHVYVTFGAGMLQKEIDMHTADNPVEAKESPDGTVRLIPYHVPTYVHPRVSALPIAYLCRPALRILQDRLLCYLEGSAS